MSDYLKLIGQLQFIRDYECKTRAEVKTINDVITILSTTAQKTGRWLRSGSDLFPFECNQCSETNERTTPWCPHCGAKMEVEHE